MQKQKILIPVILGVTTLFLIAAVTFQVLEMFDLVKGK